MMATKPVLHWRTEWDNGACIVVASFSPMTIEQRKDIERIADDHGFGRDGERWIPPNGKSIGAFFAIMRARSHGLEFEKEDENEPLHFQRLKLEPETRQKLESLRDFTLAELSGPCPVQADGQLDGKYWYFRARGTYWWMQIGGNENHTKAPTWWHEEYWPSEDGFAAGYMTHEETITCILKAVNAFRAEKRDRFEKGHPDYGRTVLEGWAIGALNLRRVIKRLDISGQEVIARMKAYGLELPYTADREIKSLNKMRSRVRGYDHVKDEWVVIKDEDEDDD